MRALNIGTTRYTIVLVVDEAGSGGACHEYHVIKAASEHDVPPPTFAVIKFQRDPIQNVGVNGCRNEDLLAIVIDRLRGFQSGQFSCRENALALTKLEEALHWLDHRTQERQKRGVEDTYIA